MTTTKFNRRFRHSDANVDSIKKATETCLTMQREATTEMVGTMPQDEIDRRFKAWRTVDGISVPTHLAMWCEALRKVNPRLKFGINSDCSWTHYAPVRVAYELWMYLPEQPYAIMRLGYKDYRTTSGSSSDPQFGIYSRLIHNEKYSEVNEQYAMSMTATFERAVTNAKKYLRAYAPHELVRIELDDFQHAVRRETQEYNSETYKARNNVTNHCDLMAELTHLVTSGYEFTSKILKEAVEEFIAKRDAMQEHNSTSRHAWFVHVYERNEKQYFDVTEMYDVHKSNAAPSVQSTQNYDEATLPEELAGKMSVLMMVEVGHRVSGVGMRATETTFYVERV